MFRRARVAVLVTLFILTWVSHALAIVWRHDVSSSLYQNLANEVQFAPVGKVYGAGDGSGTLIGDGSWVLTAAHVVQGVSSATFVVGTTNYSSTAIYIHPAYSTTTLANDLALIKLGSIVPGITPASLYTGSNELGKIGYTVGYGYGGNGLTGYTGGYGTKRAMKNVIDLAGFMTGGGITINPSGHVLLIDFDKPGGGSNSLGPWGSSNEPLDLEGMGAPGDSGGATFILEGSNWYLAGVTSFLRDVGHPIGDGSPNAKYGDLLGSVRVSSYLNWIYQYIGAPTPPPAIPEPTTLTMIAIGLVVLARRLRQ